MAVTTMIWLELEVRTQGDGVRVSARGCRGERAREQELGGGFTVEKLMGFRVLVGNAIARVQALEGEALEQARGLHEALFAGEVRDLYVRLAALASDQKQRLLVRLMIEDPNLQAVPWEAMCRPQSSHGFLAGAADVLLARGVNSVDPWQPRELRRSLVVLPVLAIPDRIGARGAAGGAERSRRVGGGRAAAGDRGRRGAQPGAVRAPALGPSPHVLHFLGHGGFDNQRNPVIRLADDADGEKTLLPIEVFAEELRASFDTMRIVYLQACSGARPGVFASAAELLARSGVDAVVAHLWPVRAEVARAAAQDFYAHLIGARAGQGDVGASMQASRRTLLASSADGFSPVLYLRGSDVRLFDLEERRLRPPKAGRRVAGRRRIGELPPALRALLQGPFSLVIGEAWEDESTLEIRARLREGLLEALKTSEQASQSTPLYSLTQRFVLVNGRLKLDRLFQKVLLAVHSQHEQPAIIDALAPQLRPGVHTTLLWLPLLEHAIARHAPGPHAVRDPAGAAGARGPPAGDGARGRGDEWEEVSMRCRGSSSTRCSWCCGSTAATRRSSSRCCSARS
jgi:hypothetical protein